MGTQKEGEARQTAIGTIFSAMLQRKSREFPSVEEFLKTIGMSFATYSQLLRGLGESDGSHNNPHRRGFGTVRVGVAGLG